MAYLGMLSSNTFIIGFTVNHICTIQYVMC